MIKKYFILFSGFIFSLCGHCMAETVRMPLTVDYPLLRSLVVYQAFAEPGETATILDEKDGCNRVTLSRPTFREENSLVRFETRVHLRLGKPLGENCLMPIAWEGYLVFYQRPRIDPATWTLSFETIDSKVYDLDRQPANIAQTIFEMISTQAYAYLNGIRIDLAPPVSELKLVFSQFFEPAVKAPSMRMLQSIRAGKAHVNANAVEIDMLMDVERHDAKREAEKSEPISDEKLERFFDQWEAWDAFLVHMLCILAPEPLSSEERQILLDTLLETRHRFIDGLTNKNLENDFVRQQFVAAWGKIAPVFRNHLAQRPSKALLGYLAFFTASDALNALDKIGPSLGIEISRNGLVRLVRLLADQESRGQTDILTYRTGVDFKLRTVLGLGPPPPATGPALDTDALDLSDGHENHVVIKSTADAVGTFFLKPAWAKPKKSADALARIKTWLYSKDNLEPYIERTRSLLMDCAQATLKKHKNSYADKKLFPTVVLSTAWQESCFRQFLVKRKKIVYLLSYNGSSVGLMQINERVWRGMYDPHHLRWDIRYNALAGCEIIDLYFRRYLEKQAKNPKAMARLKDQTRAGIIYAMYNGGPGQLDKFLSRSAKGKFYDSDKLFLEKYNWVKNAQLANIDRCLIGQ
jgi:hypothetical protein